MSKVGVGGILTGKGAGEIWTGEGGGEGFDEIAQGDKDLVAILGVLREIKEVQLHLQPQGKESSSNHLELLEGVVLTFEIRKAT